jgi:hypothetical protein
MTDLFCLSDIFFSFKSPCSGRAVQFGHAAVLLRGAESNISPPLFLQHFTDFIYR